jgi:hypothetical protein
LVSDPATAADASGARSVVSIDLRDFLSGREQLEIGKKSVGVDLTPALARAQEQSEVFGAANACYPPITLPAGNIGLSRFQWSNVASLVGAEVGSTRLVYVGPDDVPGSYLVGLGAGTGAVPYAGFYNLTFVGFDSSSLANPACAHGILNLGTHLDWGFKLKNLHFQSFFDDALQLRGTDSVFVNLFLHRIRWDSVGGFALHIGSNRRNSGSPFVLTDFTLDNNLTDIYAAKMSARGRFDGSRWGKGLIRIEDGQGISAHIANARVELNRKLRAHAGANSLVYSNQTIPGAHCAVDVQNIQGTGRPDQQVLFLRDVTGRTTFRHADVGMSGIAKLLEAPSLERDLYRNLANPGFSASLQTQQIGMQLGGHSFEWRAKPPEQVAGNFSSYRSGDLVFNSIAGAGRPVAWQCRSPTTGFAVATASNITAGASVVSGDRTVRVPAKVLSNLAVGLSVTLLGAGRAGADLSTRVIGADEEACTITVADTPVTSVPSCTIRFTPCVFAPVLYTPGVSSDRGDRDVTLTLGLDAPTQFFNTPLKSPKTVRFAISAASLGTESAANGGRFRIVRSAAATGAFNLNIAHGAGIKALDAAGQWADFEFDGRAWILTAAGSL